MKFYIFEILLLSFHISLILADGKDYIGECKNIYEYLEKKNYELNVDECIVNDEGKVTDLKLYTYCLTEEDVEKLISYETIKNLSFNTITNFENSPYDELRKCKQLENFPNSISNLKHLEK
eukprot:jgi/Orpsp1_1/1179240/evm.model.c7180000068580.1